MTVRAFKFLAPGRIGPFSGADWPAPAGGEPGAWIHAAPGPLAVCRVGVHACRAGDLPRWLDEELWAVELDAPVAAATKLVAARGRLLDRIEAWDADAAAAYRGACRERIAQHAPAAGAAGAGMLADAATFDGPTPVRAAATTAYVATLAAAHAAGSRDAIGDERAWQAAWLARRLGLGPA